MQLEQCGGTQQINKMYYTNFEDRITRPYRIVVKNWPLKDFKNPSSISGRADLSVLWNAWNTGTAHFYRMKEAEYDEWEAREIERRKEAEDRLGVLRESRAAAAGQSPPEPVAENPTVPLAPQPSPAPNSELGTTSTPADPGPSNFIMATIVTNEHGEAVATTKRTRKRRSDFGKKRKPVVEKQ